MAYNTYFLSSECNIEFYIRFVRFLFYKYGYVFITIINIISDLYSHRLNVAY